MKTQLTRTRPFSTVVLVLAVSLLLMGSDHDDYSSYGSGGCASSGPAERSSGGHYCYQLRKMVCKPVTNHNVLPAATHGDCYACVKFNSVIPMRCFGQDGRVSPGSGNEANYPLPNPEEIKISILYNMTQGVTRVGDTVTRTGNGYNFDFNVGRKNGDALTRYRGDVADYKMEFRDGQCWYEPEWTSGVRLTE
mgnify:CR=1 FL=1